MFANSPSVSPTDVRRPGVPNHRKALAVLGADGYFPPNSASPPPGSSGSYQLSLNPIAHDPFRTSWVSPASPASSNQNLPAHRHSGTFLQDASEHEISPITPAFKNGSENTSGSDVQDLGYKDFRRESVTSATSSNSKSSVRRRLHGLFGSGAMEENNPVEGSSHEDSDANATNSDTHSSRQRNNSTASTINHDTVKSRTISPRPSRPITPIPSSEVTPWMYQQYKVRVYIGNFRFSLILLSPLQNVGHSSLRRSSRTQGTHRSRWASLC